MRAQHLVATTAFVVSTVVGQSVPRAAPDECLCRELSRRYLGNHKVSSRNRTAAIQLLSWHARGNGYWRTLLDEWRKADGASEGHYVQVFGKMLGYDALGRDYLAMSREEQEQVAVMRNIALDDSVLPELIDRGRQAGPGLVDDYVIAVALARDPRSVDFLTTILTDKKHHHLPNAPFHAAVGLANLGDARGVEWLVENADTHTTGVYSPWPPGVGSGYLDECCVSALHYLSGKSELRTQAEWRKWWSGARAGFSPAARVPLLDR